MVTVIDLKDRDAKEFIIICDTSNGNLLAVITNGLALLPLLRSYLLQLVQSQYFVLQVASAAVYLVFRPVQQLPAVGTIAALSQPNFDAHHVEMMAATCSEKGLLEETDTAVL